MESTPQADQETYRAIVFGQDGKELLLAPAETGFLLPWIEIQRGQRIAETLTAAMRIRWGLDVVCLFSSDVGVPSGSHNGHSYEVMEYYEPLAKCTLRAEWVRVATLSAKTFADRADHIAVQRFLAGYIGRPDGVAQGPFAKLGWFRELQAWIEEVIGPLGFRLTGHFEQLNATPTFSLVRFGTSGAVLWFKAVGNPNFREFPLTLALARVLPKYLPPILAARREWNGWLALEARGANLCEAHDTRHWNTAASALARLQIESIELSGLLIEFGARDLRTSVLLRLVRPFLNAMGPLMEHPKILPPVLSGSELIFVGEQIAEALSLNANLGIPDGLGHLDLNPGNVMVSEGHAIFLDWADAYVGNPLFSFRYLAEHCRRVVGGRTAIESGLASAYGDEWRSLISPEGFTRALAFAPLLAVFAYALASDAWNDPARLQDAEVAGYLRGLTRRMHREASRLRDRVALWPN